MSPQGAITRSPLDATRQAKLQLEELIQQETGSETASVLQLPSEDDLSASLGWSRATVRAALTLLQKEGKVRRVHGSGTFVNSLAWSAKANIADDLAFLDLLTRLGYEPEQRVTDVRMESLSDTLCGVLRVPPGTVGWRVERLFLASGRPAVLSTDAVAAQTGESGIEPIHPRRSTFSMVQEYTGHAIIYSVADLVPVVATGPVADSLGVARGSAVLLLRHTHVDDNEKVVAATDSHVNSDIIKFSVVRTATAAQGGQETGG